MGCQESVFELLGVFWGVLEVFWGRLGASWRRLGGVLERLGGVSERLGATFLGSVRGRPGACPNLSSPSRLLAHSTSPNIALKILPFLCFTQTNIVRNPALLVFYATQHHPKSCPSCLLRPPKKVPAKKHKKGKQKVGPKNRSKIVIFRLRILPFLCFTQNGTAPGP